jgi:hypothetical protein
MGKIKRTDKVVFRLLRTLGGKFKGEGSDYYDDVMERSSTYAMNRVAPMFTGDTEALPMPEGYNQGGRIEFKHTSPTPCTIVAIMPRLVTQDGR